MKLLNDYVMVKEIDDSDNNDIIVPKTYKKTIGKGIFLQGDVDGINKNDIVLFARGDIFDVDVENNIKVFLKKKLLIKIEN